jgi:hypothetical protein
MYIYAKKMFTPRAGPIRITCVRINGLHISEESVDFTKLSKGSTAQISFRTPVIDTVPAFVARN